MKHITFEHLKPLTDGTGKVLTMKSVISIHGIVTVEVYERKQPISVELLEEVRYTPTKDEFNQF